MKEKHLDFGMRLRDNITGFTGIVINISRWNNGCICVGLKPEKLKDDVPQDTQFIDIQDLEIVDKDVHPKSKRLVGGPKPNCKSPTG